MAVSSFTTPTPPFTLLTTNPKFSFVSKRIVAHSSSSLNLCSVSSENNGNLSIRSKFGPKKWIFDLGIGVLAASVVGLSPLDANATRVEYYATVGEPSCELNFAKSGLGYCDVLIGSGVEAPLGELIDIHYTARFGDGTVFDSSYKRARPLTMRIGMGKVIKGLDQGILGGEGVPPMLVGGKRKLKIPPALAYGPEPAGCFSGDCNIPANATLLYDINFVRIYSGNAK
uniref:peptidylprolyl isomerase n=1 Tax=Francoa sonchifolia TaxID=23250 RepID=A0A0F7H0X2_9ROSI